MEGLRKIETGLKSLLQGFMYQELAREVVLNSSTRIVGSCEENLLPDHAHSSCLHKYI